MVAAGAADTRPRGACFSTEDVCAQWDRGAWRCSMGGRDGNQRAGRESERRSRRERQEREREQLCVRCRGQVWGLCARAVCSARPYPADTLCRWSQSHVSRLGASAWTPSTPQSDEGHLVGVGRGRSIAATPSFSPTAAQAPCVLAGQPHQPPALPPRSPAYKGSGAQRRTQEEIVRGYLTFSSLPRFLLSPHSPSSKCIGDGD